MAFNSKIPSKSLPGVAGDAVEDCCYIWSHDEDGNVCINIPNCVTGEDLKIAKPLPVVTGICFGGEPEIYTPDADGKITLPADKFATGEISADGTTLTLTVEGVEGSVDICLNPVKGAVIVDADGVETPVNIVDGILHFEAPEPICWGRNADGCAVVNIGNCITGENLVLDFVRSVTGNVVDSSDRKNPVINAVATVRGGGVDNSDPRNPVIASSRTVPNADGSIHTITTDDGVATPVCTDPVKSIVSNGNSTWTATTQAGATVVLRDTFATLVDNGDGTATITMPNGQTKQIVCAPLPADVRVSSIAVVPDVNADGSTSYNIELTLSDGSTLNGGPVVDTDLFSSVVPDNGDGTGTVTDANSNSIDICLNPVKSIRKNADESYTAVLADGSDGATIPASPDEWSDPVIYPVGGAVPTAPTVAGTASQVLGDAGQLLGIVDDAGYHPIVHPTPPEDDDEWSSPITINPGDAFPTVALVPNTKAHVYNPAGEIIGVVDDAGYHPIALPEVLDCEGVAHDLTVQRFESIDQKVARNNAEINGWDPVDVGGCIPRDRTGCLDRAALTFSTVNSIAWYAPPGAAGYFEMPEQVEKYWGFEQPEQADAGVTTTLTAPVDTLTKLLDVPMATVQVTNRSCENVEYLITIEEVHSEMFYTAHSGLWRFEAVYYLDGVEMPVRFFAFHRGFGAKADTVRDSTNFYYFKGTMSVPPGVHTLGADIFVRSVSVTPGATISFPAQKWQSRLTAELVRRTGRG